MKLCAECGDLLIDGQRVICDDPECFRVRMNRRAREYRRERIKKEQRCNTKRIPKSHDFQHAESPKKAIKIFDEIVENAIFNEMVENAAEQVDQYFQRCVKNHIDDREDGNEDSDHE